MAGSGVNCDERRTIQFKGWQVEGSNRGGLVLEPQQWAWSSYRSYAEGERGAVLVNEPQRAELHVRRIS